MKHDDQFAFEEGRNANRKNYRRSSNPFFIATLRDAWLEGWIENRRERRSARRKAAYKKKKLANQEA